MPGDRPYTRREMGGMSDRQLTRALGRRAGGMLSPDEIKERKKRQGYNDREDESLGMRRGPERDSSQSFKDRRDESYGRRGTRDARRRRGER